VTGKVRTAVTFVVGAGRMTLAAWQAKRAVVLAAGVGVALGAGAYYAAPLAGAVLSATVGAILAVTIKAAWWVRSALRVILPA
jgi:hypothetical protein